LGQVAKGTHSRRNREAVPTRRGAVPPRLLARAITRVQVPPFRLFKLVLDAVVARRIIGVGARYGLMFWFSRNRFVGSYLRLIWTRRS
jgi:hypothetical protein